VRRATRGHSRQVGTAGLDVVMMEATAGHAREGNLMAAGRITHGWSCGMKWVTMLRRWPAAGNPLTPKRLQNGSCGARDLGITPPDR
jgi:hypothetical protein